ncbi:MAG: D-cysteine desulfhydrase family protein [Bdellovibrio sp.]|nr:D-cysteine desulfhydrase family protein [Bdellovibrio sp.]
MSIKTVLKNFNRIQLALAPSPIHRLSRLTAMLGHNIYIMRDDLTGFALGGNKTRKLEFLIGDALKKKAQVLITSGASSFSRNAAAAGRAFGLDIHVFIVGEEAKQNRASMTFFKLMDAKLHFISEEKKETMPQEKMKLIKRIEESGQSVYELHHGGSDEVGTLSYINAFDEISDYSQNHSIRFDKIIHATGSTATQAGLVLGQCIDGHETMIIGMAIAREADLQKKNVQDLVARTAQKIGVPWDQSKVIVDDRFIGPGYPLPSKESEEAVKLFASLEGVLLDAIYTGKAAAGLIHYALNNMFAKDDNILFIHTGGNFGLFY